jgi:hypothetical protein
LYIQLHADISFMQKISKQNIYINETIKVTLQLKVTHDEHIDEVFFEEYDTSDFWIKSHKEKTIQKDKTFTIYSYEYLLDPKSEGYFTLTKQMIKVSSRAIRNNKRWLKVYSNPAFVKVLPLYDNLAIQGEDYSIKLEANKRIINENEPINLTLQIQGKGNIKDIQKYELQLNDQTVFNDAPEVDLKFEGNSYVGKFTQKFLVIANKEFIIPSLSLEYYNPKLRKVQTISTKPIYIQVLKQKVKNNDDSILKYIFTLFGIIMGVIITIGFRRFKKSYMVQNTNVYKKIKSTRNFKDLYELLVQNNQDGKFNTIIIAIENILNDKTMQKHKPLRYYRKVCLEILHKVQ